ncbi:MAG TPA: hypothetical protein DCE08_04935 [Ruminococcaceae bacterium]|nr:hypothetical protein [Oscillospiraceae bacterium]
MSAVKQHAKSRLQTENRQKLSADFPFLREQASGRHGKMHFHTSNRQCTFVNRDKTTKFPLTISNVNAILLKTFP